MLRNPNKREPDAYNLAESSKEDCGSEGAVLPMMMVMISTKLTFVLASV
jgi:hypothetical protein